MASRTMKAGEVRRAKVILRFAAGQSYRSISEQQGCGGDLVAQWKARFVKEAGLYARQRGKIVSNKIIGQEARILNAAVFCVDEKNAIQALTVWIRFGHSHGCPKNALDGEVSLELERVADR